MKYTHTYTQNRSSTFNNNLFRKLRHNPTENNGTSLGIIFHAGRPPTPRRRRRRQRLVRGALPISRKLPALINGARLAPLSRPPSCRRTRRRIRRNVPLQRAVSHIFSPAFPSLPIPPHIHLRVFFLRPRTVKTCFTHEGGGLCALFPPPSRSLDTARETLYAGGKIRAVLVLFALRETASEREREPLFTTARTRLA